MAPKATSKKTRSKKSGPKTPPKESTNTSQAISPEKFEALVRKVMSHDGTVSEHNTVRAELIKDAIAGDRLHKGAFALFMRLKKMASNKVSEFLFHFDVYRELGRFDAQGDLIRDLTADGDDHEDDAADRQAEAALADARRMRQPGAASGDSEQDPPSTSKH
jgi:hypothetical protein